MILAGICSWVMNLETKESEHARLFSRTLRHDHLVMDRPSNALDVYKAAMTKNMIFLLSGTRSEPATIPPLYRDVDKPPPVE